MRAVAEGKPIEIVALWPPAACPPNDPRPFPRPSTTYHRGMSLDCPVFALSQEHEALREAVRSLADDKIAPRAADIDRTSEFPWDVYEALVKADLHAVHIPEAYGGGGADAIATAIVIEEVARACASSSPRRREQARHGAADARGIRGGQDRVPDAGGAGRGDVLLRAVRAGGRLRRGRHAHQGGAHRLRLRAERREAVDHERRRVEVLHGDGGHRPLGRRRRHLGVRARGRRRGVQLRRPRAQARHQGLPDQGAVLRRLPDPGVPAGRRRGRGLQDRAAHAGPHPNHDRRTGAGHRSGRPGLRTRLHPRAQAVRPPRASSSWSPTWP